MASKAISHLPGESEQLPGILIPRRLAVDTAGAYATIQEAGRCRLTVFHILVPLTFVDTPEIALKYHLTRAAEEASGAEDTIEWQVRGGFPTVPGVAQSGKSWGWGHKDQGDRHRAAGRAKDRHTPTERAVNA